MNNPNSEEVKTAQVKSENPEAEKIDQSHLIDKPKQAKIKMVQIQAKTLLKIPAKYIEKDANPLEHRDVQPGDKVWVPESYAKDLIGVIQGYPKFQGTRTDDEAEYNKHVRAVLV